MHRPSAGCGLCVVVDTVGAAIVAVAVTVGVGDNCICVRVGVGFVAESLVVPVARCEVVGVAKTVAVDDDVVEGVADADFGPAAVADDVQADSDSAQNAAPAAAMHP